MSILNNKLYIMFFVVAALMLSACNLNSPMEVTVNNIAENTTETETTGCWEKMPPPDIMEFTDTETIQNTVSGEEGQADEAGELLNSMTLEQKILQMFIVEPEAVMGINPVIVIDDNVKAEINKYPVSGFIFFGKNIASSEQLKELLVKADEIYRNSGNIPPFLCIDEEGGTVARLANSNALSIENVGNMCDMEDEVSAYEAGEHIGSYLREYGFNINFAPVADLYATENNLMKYRSFGSNPKEVSDKIQAFEKGLQSFGILPVLKHFPGIGSSSGDTHTGYDVINKTVEELMQYDLLPFINGINSGADIIMVSHISAPNITGDDMPCSLSPSAINGLLRTELGFDGVVITDAMNMQAVSDYYDSGEAAVLAIEAGVDIILMPEDFKTAYDGILEAVAYGRLDEERINESVYRILKIKLK